MPVKRPAKRRSRVITISMPPEMAQAAEEMAKRENRTMSELMREAFRKYEKQKVARFFDELGEFVKTLPPSPYKEEDVPMLVKEFRANQRREHEILERKRA